MPERHEDVLDRMLARSATMTLTLNDVRILMNALDALEYFGKEDNECYIDEEGLELRARLQATYAGLMRAGRPED